MKIKLTNNNCKFVLKLTDYELIKMNIKQTDLKEIVDAVCKNLSLKEGENYGKKEIIGNNNQD